jgi:hypothetical protein
MVAFTQPHRFRRLLRPSPLWTPPRRLLVPRRRFPRWLNLDLWETGGHLIENEAGTLLIECDECPCTADCDNCSGGTQPDTIEFTLANVGNGTCSNCGEFNQTYILTRAAGFECIYEGEASTNCGNPTISFQFTDTGVNGSFNVGAVAMFGFHIILTPPYNCSTERTLTITAPQDLECDFTNATASYVGV